ncbi:MAG: hypothetical protein AAF570_18865, partial [Bacteroidota bacterium]
MSRNVNISWLFCLCLMLCSPLSAQDEDENRKGKSRWRLNSFGLSWMDGNVQFYEGYNWENLYTDAQSGLPIYTDWMQYGESVQLPEFYQFGANVAFVDSSRNLRARLGIVGSYRKDSMVSTSAFAVNDTVFGRNGSVSGRFYGVNFGLMLRTRKLANFLRFYGG